MIVVFVIDTSPSMALPVATSESNLSRLDMAKMIVEDLTKKLQRRKAAAISRATMHMGLGEQNEDAFLLLSTSVPHECDGGAAGGRLLVGFGGDATHMKRFEHELKQLKAATVPKNTGNPDEANFPETAGGAVGLNAALSAGLQLLNRYRLQHKHTENFGMGRFPSTALTTANGYPADHALQPACLFLITDGACLRQTPKQGGGSLQLQFGSQPLREFYTEPFRWDQRVFCLGVGGKEGISSSQFLHPQLRALSEVTGGSHWLLRKPHVLSSLTDNIMKRMCPPLPRELPLPDPLFTRLSSCPFPTQTPLVPPMGACFINGGPICCFQALEPDEAGKPLPRRRAMLLYTGSYATIAADTVSPPLWCIPEAFFPSKKFDTLPPRSAQPLLLFSKYPANLGSKSFDPSQLIKMLHKLDQLTLVTRKNLTTGRFLHRDVYVCEWLNAESGKAVTVSVDGAAEYYPVFVAGAGRSTLAEDVENYLNIGILHVSGTTSTLSASASANRLATLTLLPPEPHILLPLLIHAAEAEHRAIKKAEATNQSKLLTQLDERWRSEFRAYLFRLPPYYQPSIRRCLKTILPASAQSLLAGDASESIPQQCFSRSCHQKIRNGEDIARANNDRLERQEAMLRHRGVAVINEAERPILYGHFDPRQSVDSYLAVLRNMPAPWRAEGAVGRHGKLDETKVDHNSDKDEETLHSPLDAIGDLPVECLMAFYESRRRWLFGGPGLATRGLQVQGVDNDGSNTQRRRKEHPELDECPLSIANAGVSTVNETSTSRMGDFRDRLVFSRAPIVGYGSSSFSGVATTTAADGSPIMSVDNDAMPMVFFDSKTGDFTDSLQTRARARLMVNFGNPYREKRADSLIPEDYLCQAPSTKKGKELAPGSPRTPPGSPPHDTFDSVEEGEAIFVRTSPSRVSPRRDSEFNDDEEMEIDHLEKPLESSRRTEPLLSKPKPAAPPPTSTKPVPPRAKPESLPRPPPQPAISTIKVVPPPPPRAVKPPPPKQGLTGPGSNPPPPPKRPRSLSTASNSSHVSSHSDTPMPDAMAINSIGSSPTAINPSTEELQRPDVKPNVELPPGWMCVWSKSQKRWYFFNTTNNQSVWDWPPK